MNKKFFKKYKTLGYDGGYWATFAVVSDGDIVTEPEWKDAEKVANPEWIWYQCNNPEACVKEYMRKQEMVDILCKQLEEIKSEQSVLKSLLASKMPCYKPVLFDDIIVTMNDEGVVEFQIAIYPGEL